MATAKFNDVEEFLAELRLDAGDVERRIVRVTNRWRRRDPYPLQTLAVVATYRAAGDLVVVEDLCGEFMPGTQEADRVRAAAAARRGLVETAAAGLGLEVRAGVFE